MIYEEYHSLLKKYKDAENNYYNSLDKKSKLLYGVEPHGTNPKLIITVSNDHSYDDCLINYASEIKEIDNLINETRNNKDVLEHELKKKELELRASDDVYDKIYVYRWIEHKKIKQFFKLIGYSYRQTDRKIKEIENNLYPDLKQKREKLKKQIEEKRKREREKYEKVFKN